MSDTRLRHRSGSVGCIDLFLSSCVAFTMVTAQRVNEPFFIHTLQLEIKKTMKFTSLLLAIVALAGVEAFSPRK